MHSFVLLCRTLAFSFDTKTPPFFAFLRPQEIPAQKRRYASKQFPPRYALVRSLVSHTRLLVWCKKRQRNALATNTICEARRQNDAFVQVVLP